MTSAPVVVAAITVSSESRFASAERPYVSSHTVKTQVKAVHRKLGVSSRNDAVREATAIGLLGA